MQHKDQWASTAFKEWTEQRNKRSPSDECPANILETMDVQCLSKWLSLFTIEMRKKDGQKYPPASIHLLCGLQRIMCRNNGQLFDIDKTFGFELVMLLTLHNVLGNKGTN